MKIRAVLYSSAFVASLVAVSVGSFLLGEHIKEEEGRRTFLDSEANNLVVQTQIAAMIRAGAVDHSIQRAEMFIAGDVVTLDAFTGPEQPPLSRHQLSALRLASQYRDLFPASFEKPNPYDSSIKSRVDHALDLGARSGATEYQWFAAKFLNPSASQATSASPPSVSP